MPKSTSQAPRNTVYRTDVTANDVVANITFDEGLQTEEVEYTHFTVYPTGTANPSASIYYWDDVKEKWIVDADFSTKVGAGSNVPYSFSVATRGRITLLVLSAISAGSVDVHVSSFV